MNSEINDYNGSAHAYKMKRFDEIEYSCPLSDISVSLVDQGARRRLPAELNHSLDALWRQALRASCNEMGHHTVMILAAWHWVLHWVSDKPEPQATVIQEDANSGFVIVTELAPTDTPEDLLHSVRRQWRLRSVGTLVIRDAATALHEAMGCHTVHLGNGEGFARADVELVQTEGNWYVDCAASCFSEIYQRRLIRLWQAALMALADPCKKTIAELPLYHWTETQRIALGLEGSAAPVTGNLIDRFIQHVTATPEKLAVTDGVHTLNYATLDRISDAWAAELTAAGVGLGSAVGLAFDRSAYMVVAQLAVLKLGAIFIPLDAEHPQARLQSVIDDTGLQHLLTEVQYEMPLQEKMPQLHLHIAERIDASQQLDSPIGAACTDDIAYIIFTSGSTGKPKGVRVSHGNLINFLDYMRRYVGDQDISTQFAPFTFDASVAEIHAAVLNGGSLVLLSREHIESPDKLQQHLTEHRVTFSAFPPSYAKHLAPEKLPYQKTLLTAGSAPDHELVSRWQSRLTYINAYGPTETTILSTLWQADQPVSAHAPIVMGTPIFNTSIQLVNRFDHMVPPGFIGELIIGGAGVTHGYINRPLLTAEKFTTVNGKRWYRSGDLVCQDNCGRLIFYGRVDKQVKLRGRRLELGEVEAAAKTLPGVRNAAALVTNENLTSQLYLYCEGETRDQTEFRTDLAALLPQWALPNRIYWMTQLPMTANGKLDYRELQNAIPDIDATGQDDLIMTPLEKAVSSLWENVLQVPQVTLRDNFIHLGGDSLTALVVASSLKKMGYVIRSSLLLEQPVFEEFVASLENYKTQAIAVEPYPLVIGEVPHSAIQSWFFGLPLNHPGQFCQSLIFDSATPLQAERLQQALGQLCIYHDVLRTQIVPVQSGRYVKRSRAADWRQNVLPPELFGFELNWIEASDDELEAVAADLHLQLTGGIDLENGALWRMGVVQTAAASRVIWVFHHLLMDTVSHGVLLDDLYQLYSSGDDYQSLPPKTLSYGEWAAQQQRHIADNEAEIALQWMPILAEDRSCHRISDAIFPYGTLAQEKQVLDVALTDSLINHASHCFRQSAEDMVLAATLLGLTRTFGQTRIGVDIEWHGRDEEFAGDRGIARTVGWFTSVHPLFIEVNPDADVGKLLVDLKEKRATVPARGRDFYSLKHFARNETTRDLVDGFCGPDVLFNFSGIVQRSNSEWRTVPVSAIEMGSGDEYIPYNISVETELRQGQLNLHIFYNADVIKLDSVKQLLQEIQNAAAQLVSYCVHPANRHWTPSDFPLLAISRERACELPDTISAAYPLTDMQQTMYRYQQQYQVWMYYRFPRPLDAVALQKAVQTLVRKNDCLRTCCKVWGSQIIQMVLTNWQPHLEFHTAAINRSGELAEHLIAQARANPVSVVDRPAIKFDVISEGSEDFLVLLSIHHIHHDGWSINILFENLLDEYRYQLGEIKRPAPASATSMESVVRAQLQLRDSECWNQYWKTLPWQSGFCELPKKAGVKDSVQRDIQILRESLSDDLVASVRQSARQSGVTLNALWMSAYACLLRFVGRADQVRFGVIQSGRMDIIPGVDRLTGCCVNTLPMVLDIGRGQILREIVGEVNAQLAGMRESAAFPLSQIEVLAGERAGRHLFETLFNVESYNYAGGKVRERPQLLGGYEATNSALTFSVIEGENSFGLRVGFDRQVFAENEIQQLMAAYIRWVELLVGDLSCPWSQCEGLSKSQREQLAIWNETSSVYPRESHLWELFTEQVQEQGDKIALWETTAEGATLKMSYTQLQARAEQLARRINLILPVAQHREAMQHREIIVGVMSERSASAVVAWLALARLGYAYLPLDPQYPTDRLQHMINDADCALVLTQNTAQIELLPQRESYQVLPLDRENLYQGELPEVAVPTIGSDRLVYVMYTSGSTGKPKGVMIEQASIVRLIKNTGYAPLSSDDHVLLTGAPVFDATTYEVWGSLLNGGTLSIVHEHVLLDTEQLADTLAQRQITTLWLTAPLFNQHVQQKPAMFAGVRQLLVGGDALSVEHIRLAKRANPQLTLINGYGPTENTTFSVCHRLEADQPLGEISSIPIGRPIHNSTAHVVNDAGQPVPVGVCGELWVGGEGVARGYLNRPDLTAEKFIADPFSHRPDARLYKTGDLVRWTREGFLEFIGRVDDQVKIRGFRIELGEIDTVLTRHRQVEEARVLVKQDGQGNKQLVGYVAVGAALAELDQSALRCELLAYLREQLPDYMVPAALVLLERLPLNSNGKVDRRQLPEPEFAATDVELMNAASATEKNLLQLVSQVLGRECKNIGADFFSLGGSSLDAVRLIAEIRTHFSIDINVSAIFNAVNLHELATLLDQQIEAVVPATNSETLGAPTPGALTAPAVDLNSLSDKALDDYLQQLISEQGV